MRFSADRQRLYLVTSDASTRVIDLATKAQVDTLSGAGHRSKTQPVRRR